MVSGVRHAGEILDLFTPHAPEWGAAGAACEVGISRTHAHRLLWSLADLGLLERQPNRRYRLGMRSLTLASVLLDTSPLVTNALPLLRSLNDRLGLDAALAVWERRGVLWLQPGADPLLMHRRPVTASPAWSCLRGGRTRRSRRPPRSLTSRFSRLAPARPTSRAGGASTSARAA